MRAPGALTLRAIAIEDAVAAHRLCAHPGVARHLGVQPVDGVEGWKRRVIELPHARASLIGAFDEEELVSLTLAVVAINGWNRLAIAFRSPVGSYVPGQHAA